MTGIDGMDWALVTGASGRGGAAIARALHAAGLGVVLHHSPRSLDEAQALQRELDAVRPGATRLWSADLAQSVQLPDTLKALAVRHCVCNASVYQPSRVEDTHRAQEDWAVHVAAHAAILAALRPTLASVVAVGDIHVARPARGQLWYTVAKAALQSLVLTLAVEWAPQVRCNVVAPGALPFPDDWTDEPRRQAVRASIPMGHEGRFDDLAQAVAWLLLHAPYITGQVLPVDGGRSRWLV